jgi:hypothetical protein
LWLISELKITVYGGCFILNGHNVWYVEIQMNGDSGGDTVKQVAEKLWLSVVSDFDNESVHNTFIQYCTATHQLPLAGEKYKSYREQKGDSPLIENCINKVVVSAQLQCLPDKEKGSAAGRGPLSRLFVCLLFLITGFFLVVFWLSYPAFRLLFIVGVALLAGIIFYRFKG